MGSTGGGGGQEAPQGFSPCWRLGDGHLIIPRMVGQTVTRPQNAVRNLPKRHVPPETMRGQRRKPTLWRPQGPGSRSAPQLPRGPCHRSLGWLTCELGIIRLPCPPRSEDNLKLTFAGPLCETVMEDEYHHLCRPQRCSRRSLFPPSKPRRRPSAPRPGWPPNGAGAPGQGPPCPCSLASPRRGTAPLSSLPVDPVTPEPWWHLLIQPPEESQVDELLGILSVCPPAGDVAVVVIITL